MRTFVLSALVLCSCSGMKMLDTLSKASVKSSSGNRGAVAVGGDPAGHHQVGHAGGLRQSGQPVGGEGQIGVVAGGASSASLTCCVNQQAFVCPDAAALDRCAGRASRCFSDCMSGNGDCDRCASMFDTSACRRDSAASCH